MAARNRQVKNQVYIYGSAVRKTIPMERPQRTTRPAPRRRIDQTVRRNQEKALYMDLPYVVMLTLAAACVLYLCVGYLKTQSSMTGRIYQIEKLEKKLEQLKSENDALATRIQTSVDLDYVYKVATEELGMVYANRNQVLLYDKTESEYVRQYEDIP